LGVVEKHVIGASRFRVSPAVVATLEEEYQLVEDLRRQLLDSHRGLHRALDLTTTSAAESFRIDKYDSITSLEPG
jgi:hypothetical protein